MPRIAHKAKPTELHNRLKNWLLELGKKAGYESFSGDSEPIDIRVKRSRIEYKPDVVWVRKGLLYFIELAFTEDWRAILGEFILASLKRNSRGFFVVRIVRNEQSIDHDYNLFTNFFKVVSRKKRMEWAFYLFTMDEANDLSYVKQELKKKMKEYRWL